MGLWSQPAILKVDSAVLATPFGDGPPNALLRKIKEPFDFRPEVAAKGSELIGCLLLVFMVQEPLLF